MSINPIEEAIEALFSSSGPDSEEIDLDYNVPRDPRDSNLSWEFEEARDNRILKRYPPKLLDRAAVAIERGDNFHLKESLENSYTYQRVDDGDEKEIKTEIEVEANLEDGVFGLRIQNDYGASGIKAYLDNGAIQFEEYLGDSYEDLNFGKEAERTGKAYLGHLVANDNYRDFLEGLDLERDCLVIR